MKKKLFILTLFIFLLIPFNVKGYTYEGDSISGKTMIDYKWITSWPTVNSYIKVNSSETSKMKVFKSFYFHSIKENSNIYVGHCASIGKHASNSTTPNYPMNLVGGIESMTNGGGSTIPESQQELLKNLLVNGYHFDTTNTKDVSTIKQSQDSTLSMMAMQILIWELMEGGRTTFTQIEPNIYNESDSAYRQYVEPNGREGNVQGSLYYYYAKIINDVNKAMNPSDATAFNTSVYNMTWDTANKRYSVNVTGLGDYKNCSSNNNNINIISSNNGITITSNKEIDEADITCSYTVGSGTNDYFYYFSFKNQGRCLNGDCQNLVYGSGKRTYSKSFKVKSESTKLKIRKIGIDKKNLSGSKFRLTHRTSTDYTVTIEGNSNDPVVLNKTGEYIVSEISTPTGYEKIDDFNIKIDASSNKVVGCTSQGVDNSGNMTCMKGQVGVTYSGDTINLTIVDIAKNFKIQKLDKNNKGIKGATFQIKNNKNEVMKFNLYEGNIFAYNTSGTITNIHLDNSSSYPIALLPEGEYTIVETGIPFPYRLSSKEEERTTKIKINSNRDMLVYDEGQKTYVASVNAAVKITNYTTVVKIIKTGDGKALEGVKFLLYKEDKNTEVRCNMTSSGVYDYVEDQNSASRTEYITNKDGYITVNYLPVGTYYFKEIETLSPYVLPEGDAAYTKVDIDVTKEGSTVNKSKALNTINISNTKTSFNFYKIDEDGNYLTTGKFKLQKYDEEAKRYVDIKLVQIENDGTHDENADIFKEDKEGKVQFGLTNGIATFVEMTPSTRYRIVETVAPEGFVRQDSSDTANVTLDAYGNASGLLVLTNQKVLKEDSEAQAELIINIQTGQTRIKYGIIIGTLIIIIGALLVFLRKKK